MSLAHDTECVGGSVEGQIGVPVESVLRVAAEVAIFLELLPRFRLGMV